MNRRELAEGGSRCFADSVLIGRPENKCFAGVILIGARTVYFREEGVCAYTGRA